MKTRGVRGAITVQLDQIDLVLEATRELLETILSTNPGLRTEDIASAFFTVTDDIVSVHPALAARQIGWDLVPMMCTREIPVPGSLLHCIRVLIQWNTDCRQDTIRHVYLREAASLRPDLVSAANNQ